MFSQFFGHYLLNHGFITREQLTDALEFEKSVHVKFGVIAVDEGFMTAVQVADVHEKQKQMDKRFGEIAIELGYLTNDQVDALVSKQKQKHLFLAQALVDRGYMTIGQFESILNNYKKENSLSDEQFEAIKIGSIDALIENVFHDEERKLTYGKYLSLFTKNMYRFIDDEVYLEVSEQNENLNGDWVVYQEIIGESPLNTTISADREMLLYIASKHAEEELTELDELAKASVSEFLNLTNGIYLVNRSNWGTELTMNPPIVSQGLQVLDNQTCVDVHTSKGTFQLILG
ncbi:hypothetical protein [Pseudoneobacillus sp. C159]